MYQRKGSFNGSSQPKPNSYLGHNLIFTFFYYETFSLSKCMNRAVPPRNCFKLPSSQSGWFGPWPPLLAVICDPVLLLPPRLHAGRSCYFDLICEPRWHRKHLCAHATLKPANNCKGTTDASVLLVNSALLVAVTRACFTLANDVLQTFPFGVASCKRNAEDHTWN